MSTMRVTIVHDPASTPERRKELEDLIAPINAEDERAQSKEYNKDVQEDREDRWR